ncbi:MAG: membrane or secreted protein [Flavobacteriaceae bacterium]|nr:membrane or secreted protein [Flavobacteriaceae bacterium]|tara:strand:+ start:32632 stop:33348 length:717 start_codon:yes stop_codon:yes gene_type:complete
MKLPKILFTHLFILILSSSSFAQSLVGAWESFEEKNNKTIRSVLIVSDEFQVLTKFDKETGAFIETNGGSWKLKDGLMTEVVEFHTSDTSAIGKSFSFKIKLSQNKIEIPASGAVFTRIDDAKPGALQGAWLMSGRVRNGKTQLRNTDRPRKTMKILSGTRFQWIAYNIATKEFKGTGGGTYTTIDGKYTEQIEFFSRDNNKVGLKLPFDFELVEGKWHHKGFSSKGAAMHEIWSKRD